MSTQNNHSEDKPLIYVAPSKRRIFFIILFGLFMIDFIARVGINAIFPIIQEDLGLSDSEVGMMGSVVLFGMAAFVLPISFLGEKYSPKKAISISAFVWTIGTFLSGLASSYYLLLVSRFLVGTGNSAYAPLSNSLITSMYCKKDWGKMIGIYNMAMTFGMAAGSIVFANIAASYGWRAAFYSVGAVSFALALMSLSLPDSVKLLKQQYQKKHDTSKKEEKNEVRVLDALKVLGKNKALIGVCLGAGFTALVLQGIASWVSIFYVREMNMSVQFAATLVSAASLISSLGYPIGGALMDKWYVRDKRGRVYLPAICLTLAVISFIIAFYFHVGALVFAGMFLITTANTSFHVATQELVPSWYKSVSYGVYVLFIQLFGAFGPMITGSLSEAFGLTQALSILQISAAIAVVVFIVTSLWYVKDFNKARMLEEQHAE